MALTQSNMMELGHPALDFNLPSTDGDHVSLDNFADAKALVVMFICNHCPFVIHIAPALPAIAEEYMQKGVAFVAINSNDAESHPADNFDNMKAEKAARGYPFPYLYDESQAVAKAYDAACTPDIYVFDQNQKLVYRGQFDESRPDSGKQVTGQDLRQALDQILAGEPVSDQQHPSMGCNIKWKPGNEPT